MTQTQPETQPEPAADGVELTVLMPCLNEADTLATCITKAQGSLRALGIDGEVLVADNGSTDGSQDIARALGARVVDVPVRGYGAALMAGITAARGTYVIMADADDSYALDDLGPFVTELRAGADLVMGNRFEGGIADGAMPPLHRYLGNPLLSWVGRVFFRTHIGDFHCGMRGFRRDRLLALDLRTTGMEFASEMVVKSALNGRDIREVPTTLRPDGRTSGTRHLRTWRDGWRHLRFLLIYSPRWLFLYPGLALSLVGIVGMAWLAGGPRTIGEIGFDLQSMLVFATMSVIGVQALVFGVIARAMATALGLLPGGGRIHRAHDLWSLERGLVVGALVGLLGLGLLAYQVVSWGRVGFGALDLAVSMRLSIVGATLLMIGTQVFFGSFVASMTRVPHS